MKPHDPDRLDITAGMPGLWVVRALFFVTFAMGAYALLAAVGGVVTAARGGDPEVLPLSCCVFLVGLGMAVPGGLVAFGSGRRELDRSRRIVNVTWSLLGVPLRQRLVRFDAADAVVLERIPGEHEFYTGAMRGVTPRLELFRFTSAAAARQRGREVAAFMGLPLVDVSNGTELRVEPDQLDDDFAARHARAVRPDPRELTAIAFEESSGGATLRFPAKGFGPLDLLVIAPLTLLALPSCVAVPLAALAPGGPNGELLANAVCYGIGIGLLALIWLVPLARYALVGTTLEVREGGLTVRHHGLSRRVYPVPGSDVHAITHVTRSQMQGTPGMRLRPGEIRLQLADRDLAVGMGQPDDELAWAAAMLTWQLVRTAPARGPSDGSEAAGRSPS